MSKITRRRFVTGAMVAGASAMLSKQTVFGAPNQKVRNANGDIRTAIVGLRGKGNQHMKMCHKIPGVRIVALCDADRAVLDRRAKEFGKPVKKYIDFRHVLEDKDIDAIVVATPNHWHALMTIWACQAGKDVYVEKPVCHNIFEGQKMVEAAAKYKRIVQVGTQGRSNTGLMEVFQYIQEGNLGKINLVRGFCYKRRSSIGLVNGPQPIPKSVDYNLWSGPASVEPLMRKSLHYDWHWQWLTGNGDIGNQGIHEMDMCRWALGQDQWPKRVLSVGGRFGYVDDGQTPNTQFALFEYDPAPILFEVRGLPTNPKSKSMDHYKSVRVGLVVECENGYYAGGGSGGWVYDKSGKRLKQFKASGAGNHQANFFEVVRSRKLNDLHANIHNGYLSSSLCHLANISLRCGQTQKRGQISEQVKATAYGTESFDRLRQHLTNNEIDLEKSPATMGAVLQTDPVKQTIRHDEPATQAIIDGMVTRQYRKPFVVPDRV